MGLSVVPGVPVARAVWMVSAPGFGITDDRMEAEPSVLDSLRTAVEATPDDVPLRVHLAGMLMAAGLRDEAVRQVGAVLRKERHPCLRSEQATLATREARSLTSPGPQIPAPSMAATFSWSARGLALEWPWHVASPWAATG
jgi:hypothetical protein